MLLRIRWWRRGSEERELRLARFRQVLLSARRTPRYRPALDRAGLSSPRDVSRVCAIEEALHKLPYMDWAEFRSCPRGFQNPAAPASAPPRLRYPTNRKIRMAVVGAHCAESNTVRLFHSGWTEQIRQFEPEAIAAPVSVLKRLSGAARYKGRSAFPTLTCAVIALTGLEHGAISASDRNTLWQAFEVPIFEQCLAPDGALLAWECEAHEGLHTVEENAIVEQTSNSELIFTSLTDHRRPAIRVVTPLTASFQDGTCGCGLSGPRIIGLTMSGAKQDPSALAVVAH